MLRAQLLLAAVLLGACDPVPIDPEAGCGTGPGSIEVARGAGTAIEPIPMEGGELEIIRGPQGGIHVLVGTWFDDIDLELTLTYRLTDVETQDEIVAPVTLYLRPSLVDRTGPRPKRGPDLLIIDSTMAPVDAFDGRSALLEAEAVSADGSHACDTRIVTLVGE